MITIGLVILVTIAVLGGLAPIVIYRSRLGWELTTYIIVTALLAVIGFDLWWLNRDQKSFMTIIYVVGMLVMSFAGMALFLGLMEFGVLRLIGLFQLGAIARVTYYEALLQPFTMIILGTGIAAIGITARLGFFTYNEDFKMYRDVASSFVFLFSMPVMVFASTKVIDEEIENRTMLTLMSKPVSRTQVVLGKYVGVLLLVLAAVMVLGTMAVMCSYLRYFDDMILDFRVARNMDEVRQLFHANNKAILALLPSMVLTFLQLATLAAISVAISTRFGLAVNVTVVVIVYIAASLVQFIGNTADLPAFARPVVSLLAYLLPGLGVLDLNQRLIFSDYTLGNEWAGPNLPTYGMIWQYVAMSGAYAALYVGAVLAYGVALFRTRELT